ncbi:MAG: hypothetical protein MAG451_01411 [Anaerolineales bacterium]|nr:hypothetical protein [Anaerolineales bacterium]
MAKRKKQGDGQVVIRLDSKLFYGLAGGLAFVVVLAIVFYLGLMLGGGGGSQQAAAPQTGFQQPGLQQQSQTSNAVQSIQPDQAEQAPFNNESVRQARRPAGDEVPIGDNSRLALPELATSNYVYDFGDIPPDEIQETQIMVENKGSQPLQISSVRGSCGCTVANTGENTVAPGESTQLRVTYDPTYNNDVGQEITRQILVESNDPAAPVVEFTIRANVLNQ